MEVENAADIPHFREQLKEMQVALKKGMAEDEDFPEELNELVASMGRLETELGNKKNQQFLNDFFSVFSFIQGFSEATDDDEFDEDEDDFFDEDDLEFEDEEE